MDKKYTIEVTHTSKGFNIVRENNGFSVYELIGFIELMRGELLQQAVSMFDNADIERRFTTPKGRKGEVEINIKDDSLEKRG